MSKFDVEKFAKLARIKLSAKESEKIGKDLEEILGHFGELEKVNTKSVKPMTGGTDLVNIFREDKETESNFDADASKKQFPETRDGYLHGPKVL